MFPVQVRVISTTSTEAMYIGERVYERYPVVDLEKPRSDLSVYFIDTLQMSNVYLAGLGGDKIVVPSISNDGNKVCERLTSGVA